MEHPINMDDWGGTPPFQEPPRPYLQIGPMARCINERCVQLQYLHRDHCDQRDQCDDHQLHIHDLDLEHHRDLKHNGSTGVWADLTGGFWPKVPRDVFLGCFVVLVIRRVRSVAMKCWELRVVDLHLCKLDALSNLLRSAECLSCIAGITVQESMQQGYVFISEARRCRHFGYELYTQ